MGEVYKARDTRLNRLVAIKVLAAAMKQDRSALARFEREARILAGLNHPNIVAIYDVGSDGLSPYVVTELLEGETLADLLKRGPLAPKRAVSITVQIAEGLMVAHAKGIVHRDLKPSNVFLTRDGRVKILDFGLAKDLRLDMDSTLSEALPVPGMTLKGTVMGTVGYMAPEQVRGEAADVRSDLFALGVLLLEMLTGCQAFTGDSAVEVLHAILRVDPLEGRNLPPDLLPLMQRLLAKNPDDRFQTAKDLRFVLENPISGSVRVSPQSVIYSRFKWGVLGLGLALIAVVGIALGAVRVGWLVRPQPLPKWSYVTPVPGMISSARFTPDGQSLAFSYRGPDGHMLISTFSEGDAFPHPTGRMGRLLAIGRGKELFFSEPDSYATHPGQIFGGLLQHWNGPQTEPRILSDDVMEADLHPNGTDLLVVKRYFKNPPTILEATYTLEAPLGKEILRTKSWLGSPRWDPDGRCLAFLEREVNSWAGRIIVMEPKGAVRFRSPIYPYIRGLAWAPDGQHLVFTHSPVLGEQPKIVSVDLKGNLKELLSTPTTLIVLDVDPLGRLLVASDTYSQKLSLEEQGRVTSTQLPFVLATGAPPVTSPDGAKVAFPARESMKSSALYVRNSVDGTLVRIMPNAAPLAFSNDNQWLLVEKYDPGENRPSGISIVPLGPGVERALNWAGLGSCIGGLMPDVDHPLVVAYFSGGMTGGLFRLHPTAPPKEFAHALQGIFTFVHAGGDTYYLYAEQQGLFRGSLDRDAWASVSGPLSKFIPLARDLKTGELLAVPQAELLPRVASKPISRLPLYRVSPGANRITADRVIDLTGMGVEIEFVSFSANTTAIAHNENVDRLMIVKGVLPEFRK